MPLEGHWQRTRRPLRKLSRRERIVAIVTIVATALAIVVLIVATAGSSRPEPGPGCIRATIAHVMGGEELNACGARARRLCARNASRRGPERALDPGELPQGRLPVAQLLVPGCPAQKTRLGSKLSSAHKQSRSAAEPRLRRDAHRGSGVEAGPGHIGLNVSDYERSRAFYERALAPLGFSLLMEPVPRTGGFGRDGKPWFWITDQRKPASEDLHVHRSDRTTVEAFHAAAPGAGGTDNGGPGIREVSSAAT